MATNETLDYTINDPTNIHYRKTLVELANGRFFKALNLPDAEKKALSHVLYCHINRLSRRGYVGITQRTIGERWSNGLGYKEAAKTWFTQAIEKCG